MMNYLAEAAFTMADLMQILGWVTTFVASVIGAVMIKNARVTSKAAGKAEGKAEAMGVLVTNSPLEVRLEKEFVTRREFERLESNMNSHVAELKGIVAVNSTEMKSLFMQTMASVAAQNTSLTNKVERSNKTLSDKIEQVANGAWQGRKDLWVQVNTQREDLGALKATSNVADQIGKLAEAINPQQTRVQPTHSNPASKA